MEAGFYMMLFEFAYSPDYDRRIAVLSKMCPEQWSFGQERNSILKSYIENTFIKVYDENKIFIYDEYCLMNTGLYTEFFEDVYLLFTLNRNDGRQKWFLDGFYTSYQLMNMGINEFPPRADYFFNPAAMVFDPKCDIIPQYSHILNDMDNFRRLPFPLQESSNLVTLLDGAVKRAKNMISENYRTAVPQYYKGRIQLLIPICLLDEYIPDLAMVVSKNESDTQYLGHTCLTLQMAYNNARLIGRVDSFWLHP